MSDLKYNRTTGRVERDGVPVTMTKEAMRLLAMHDSRKRLEFGAALPSRWARAQTQVFNGPVRSDGAPWFSVVNADGDSPEILIYDQIGKDWLGEGTGAKDFVEALNKIPKAKTVKLRLNSPGGNVYDGLAITNAIIARGNVDTQVDGVAASIAATIFLGGKNRVMGRGTSVMTHGAAMGMEGTKHDFKDAIARLEIAERNIAAIYQERAGLSQADALALLEGEHWMDGAQAKAKGFCTQLSNAGPVTNNFQFPSSWRVPESVRNLTNSAANGGQNQHTNLMDKSTIIALLKKRGATVDENATVETLEAQLETVLANKQTTPPAPAPAVAAVAGNMVDFTAIQAQMKAITEQRDAERKSRITARVDGFIAERRIEAAERAFWVNAGMADETALNTAAARVPQLPPEGISQVFEADASIQDVSKGISRLSREIITDVLANPTLASSKAISRERLIQANMPKFASIWNGSFGAIRNEGTNTVDAQLQQDVIISMALRAFKRVLLPMSRLATIFSNVALRGTAKVQVPYLALDATPVTDWNASNGYVAGDTTNDNREITVDKRKYLGISYTSTELARQPFLMVQEQMELKGESLAFQVWKDVWSVVTLANFGAAPTGWPIAANAISSNNLIDLIQVADEANWPEAGRLLFVNAAYNNGLMKDNAFKQAYQFGSSEVLKTGKLPNILGFEYATNVNLQDNSESLAGVIMQRNAILVATAPIPPTEDVLRDGTQYSLAIDPETGIAIEYRSFGDSQKDKSLKFIESNYGYAKGVAANLKRLTIA